MGWIGNMMRIEPPSWGYNEIQYNQQYHMEIVSLVGGKKPWWFAMEWRGKLGSTINSFGIAFSDNPDLIPLLAWFVNDVLAFSTGHFASDGSPNFFWDVHHQNVGKIDREGVSENNIHMKDVALDFLCSCYWSRLDLEVVKKNQMWRGLNTLWINWNDSWYICRWP